MTNPLLVLRLRRNGIRIPLIAIQEAKRAHLELAILCAVLEQESGGGENVFGHDPTIFRGAGEVTEAKYKAYLAKRGPNGRGGMQGVGPMQLTWYTFQDRADGYGGCWQPRYNARVGAELLVSLIRRNGLHAGLKGYNGAEPYALAVLRRVRKWRTILKRKAK